MNDPLLYSLLDSYNVDTLFAIIRASRFWQGGSKKPAKSNLIEWMAQNFFSRERVLDSFDKLNKTEHAVLVRLQQYDGEVNSNTLQRITNRLALTEPVPVNTKARYYSTYEGSPDNPNSKVFDDVIARLTYHGLVFSRAAIEESGVVAKQNFSPGRILFIPAIVLRHLPPAPPLEAAEEFKPSVVKTANSQLFLRNLYLYWDFVRRNSVDLLQSGMVGKRSLKAINSVLLVPDPAIQEANREEDAQLLYLYRQLLEALNLLKKESASRLVAVVAKPAADFWNLALPEQAVALVHAWCQLPEITNVIEELRRFPSNERLARSRLLELMSKQGQSWRTPAELAEQLQTKDPNFLFSQRSSFEATRNSYSFYQYGFYGDAKALMNLFDKAEEYLIRFTIGNILVSLGLAELSFAKTESTTWDAARLTPLGQQVLKSPFANGARSVMESKPQYSASSGDKPEASEGRVVVQPNFQVLAMGPVPISVLAQLDQFAERRKIDPTVFEYYLTRQSVYAGLQIGLTADEIESSLRDLGGNDLPQNVVRSLHEWGAHHDRIVFRSDVTLLQTASAEMLDQLMANSEINKYLERALTAEVALLKNGQLGKLQKSMLSNKLLPAISDDKPAAADHSVNISADGKISPIHSVPNLHLTGRLAKIAESHKEGWRLTLASVRKTGGSRKKVEELLAELTKLQRGLLPEEVIANIKKWGSYFGTASVETLTLIEFSDSETLSEVIRHPKLKDKLTPFQAGERAIVTVASKDFKHVKEQLHQLGVDFR